jgi:hypothetical protein
VEDVQHVGGRTARRSGAEHQPKARCEVAHRAVHLRVTRSATVPVVQHQRLPRQRAQHLAVTRHLFVADQHNEGLGHLRERGIMGGW